MVSLIEKEGRHEEAIPCGYAFRELLLHRPAVFAKHDQCNAGVSSLIYKIWERAGNEEFKAHFRPIFAAKMSSTSASSQNAVASPSKAALETSVAAAVAHFNRQVGELDRGKDRRVLPPHYPRPPASLMSWSSGHRYNREDENWFYKMYRYLIETFGREITDVEMALLIIEAVCRHSIWASAIQYIS